MRPRAFTLIELVIVILIIGILAVTLTPKFIDIKAKAASAVEDSVIAALKEGVHVRYMENVISGKGVWPGTPDPDGDPFPVANDIFSLLQQKPPSRTSGGGSGDGVNWTSLNMPASRHCVIFCPHYKASGSWSGYIGHRYYYNYSTAPVSQIVYNNSGSTGTVLIVPGDIVCTGDFNH